MQDRVQNILESKQLTSSKFAEMIDVPRSTISHIISGRNKPSLDLITKIANTFPDISIDWLILGKGDMLKTKSEEKATDSLFKDKLQTQLKLDTEDENNTSKEYPGLNDNDEDKTKELPPKVEAKTNENIDKILIIYNDNTFDTIYPRNSEK